MPPRQRIALFNIYGLFKPKRGNEGCYERQYSKGRRLLRF